MKVVEVYKCLCDEQRLRILNLLQEGPLCVCHIMEILDEGQVKVSKQLRYMKELGMVEATREANWMIYSIPEPHNPLLVENLKCLQDLTPGNLGFKADLKKRGQLLKKAQKREALPAAMASKECCS